MAITQTTTLHYLQSAELDLLAMMVHTRCVKMDHQDIAVGELQLLLLQDEKHRQQSPVDNLLGVSVWHIQKARRLRMAQFLTRGQIIL